MELQSIKSEFEKASKQLSKDIVERDLLLKNRNILIDKRTALKQRVVDAKEARIVLQNVAKQTMSNLEYHLSSLVTLALKSVNAGPEWPSFVAEVTIRRNQVECDLLFEEEGEKYKPIDGAGGGPLDIASFALRVTFWSLKKNRACFILDEPFKFLSPDLQEKASNMIKMVSKKLGVQIIMVSHQEDINVSSDKVYRTAKHNKVVTLREEE